MRLLGFGDNIVDRFVDRHREYPGGNAVNVAVYTQRAGDHAEYLGVFGTDEAATFLRESIEAEGVSTRECVVKPGDSGIALLRSINGERTFIGGNEGGVTSREPIDLEDGRLEYARSFHVVHTSIYSEVEPSLPGLQTPIRSSHSTSLMTTKAAIPTTLHRLHRTLISRSFLVHHSHAKNPTNSFPPP